MPKVMFGVKELAEESNLDTRTIRKFIYDGDLPAMQLGHSIRILREDWKKFLEERKMSSDKKANELLDKE